MRLDFQPKSDPFNFTLTFESCQFLYSNYKLCGGNREPKKSFNNYMKWFY